MKERRHESGAEKRRKKKEATVKLQEEIKRTPSLFQLGFTRSSAEDQACGSTAAGSASDVMATDLPSEVTAVQMAEPQDTIDETAKTDQDFNVIAPERQIQGPEFQKDVGLWENITNAVQEHWCSRDPVECQHFDCDFSASRRQYDDGTARYFTRSMMFRKHVNGEQIKREWLMYSPTSGNVYCFPCVLFRDAGKGIQTQFCDGFSDWKNASQRIQMHENSEMHRACMQALITRRRAVCRLDCCLQIQFDKEKEYWIKVLQRVVSVVKFLSSRGLAFRGENENIGSQHNGNYLGVLELIAQYDPFLSSHLAKYGNQGRGRPSYLSSTICEEIIEIMGNQVLAVIVKELQQSKYFSLSVDSTPDISHIDQLTVVVRYVRMLDGEVMERFLTFIPIESHTGEALATTVLKFLNKCDIDIKNLRGQSYDNAANMSGRYNGLQAHICQINPLAHYIPCAAHSLNLVGVSAAETCVNALSFFALVQKLFNFFSASTSRWAVMSKCLENEAGSGLVLKRVTGTRWCERADATKALSYGYSSFQKALSVIAEDVKQKPETIHEAKCLLQDLSRKETAVMSVFWAVILERINAVSKSLQKETIELQTAVNMLQSLSDFLTSQRDLFDEYEEKANEKVEAQYSDDCNRFRKRKRHHADGDAEEVVLLGKDKFRIETYLLILDKLSAELNRRMRAYGKIQSLFGFLVEFPSKTDDELRHATETFRENYPDDIDIHFQEEMVHFKYFALAALQFEDSDDKIPASQSYKLICDNMIQSTFPNVLTALRIYRCLMITNATGERTFSKLKILKNCHRVSMTQERLNTLAIMATENDVLQNIDFQDILNDFTTVKLRQKTF
jgi:hypothetical protein